MEHPFIKFTEFNPANMVPASLDAKQSKPRVDPANPGAGAQSVSYHVTALLYEYDVVDQRGNPAKVVAPLSVEAPELYSPQGIQSKINAQGFETASLFTVFDMTKDDVKAFCSLGPEHTGMAAGFWQVFYKWCMERVWALRMNIPTVARLPAPEALLGMFNYPLFFTRDPATSKVTAGSNPSKYFNLLCYGKPGSATRKETLFKVPITDGEVAGKKQYRTLPWSILRSVEMIYKPIITFKQLYIGGGKITLQFEISSAVVRHVVPINSESVQDSSLAEYESNDTVRSTIAAQIEVLTRRLENSRADGTSAPPLGAPGASPAPGPAGAAPSPGSGAVAPGATPAPGSSPGLTLPATSYGGAFPAAPALLTSLPVPSGATGATGTPERQQAYPQAPAMPQAPVANPFAGGGMRAGAPSAVPSLQSMMAASNPTTV